MKRLWTLFVLMVFIALTVGCRSTEVLAPVTAGDATATSESKETTVAPSVSMEPIERSEFIYGTLVSVKLFDHGTDELLDLVFARLNQLDGLLSTSVEGSDIYKINQSAGYEAVFVSDETLDIVTKAIGYSKLSDGAFDLSVQPLVALWGIGSEGARIPSSIEIKNALGLIDYSKIQVNTENKTVFLPEKGMGIDLGAIAKGYAADAVIALLKENQVERAIVNLGGNVIVLGSKAADVPWNIGIQNPEDNRGEYIGIAKVSDQTVVTSGIYERYFEQDGKRYHHLLDTATGYPIENEIAGVSIIASQSVDADALSTVAFALGIEKGIPLIESLDGVEVIYITKEHTLYASSGVEAFFTLTDTDYQWGQ